MSVFTSLCFLVLAVLILSFLQLPAGVFTLFYHYALGKNSKKRASFLSLFFIAGVGTIFFALFLACYFLIFILFLNQPDFDSGLLAWLLAIIFFVFSLVSLLFYFRKSSGTELYIPRSFAKAFSENAKSVKTRSDAFALGAFSAAAEIPFTLPVLILASVEIMRFDSLVFPREPLAFFTLFLPLVPLFFLRGLFRADYTLAEVERLRVHDKTFFRLILCLSYLTIGILIIVFRIMHYGIF